MALHVPLRNQPLTFVGSSVTQRLASANAFSYSPSRMKHAARLLHGGIRRSIPTYALALGSETDAPVAHVVRWL